MADTPRHKYVVVLGSCCSADAIRTKNLEDIKDSRLRLLWYQGRTSPLSMATGRLEASEFIYSSEAEKAAKRCWELTMVSDELEKRQQQRLIEVIRMSDALILDFVSAFGFPYLVVQPDRCFLRSNDWRRYIVLQTKSEQKKLWEFPVQLSCNALRNTLEPLYELKPTLRVIFHVPKPCFNDGIAFDDPQVAANADFYSRYGEQLYCEALKTFPRVSIVSCGGERADPMHYIGPYPFHYDESYMAEVRKEIERLLE